MKNNTAVGLVIAAIGAGFIGLGIWLGVWVMFIGGITNIIDACKASPTDSSLVALGVAKIVFCEVPFLLSWFGAFVGAFGLHVIVDE